MASMIILDADAVRAALPMRDALDAVRWAYRAVSSGKTVMPARLHLTAPGQNGVTLVMPCAVEGSADGALVASLVVKTVSVYPNNPAEGKAAVLGSVLVLEPSTGEPIGLLDASALTILRTGAGTGVATDLLARPDASVLALFGAGGQAAGQVAGVCAVRPLRRVWLVNRSRERAEKLRNDIHRLGAFEVRIAGSAREALAEADIVCTATGSPHPLFDDRDLRPGTHINAIGAFRPNLREVPSATVGRARVYVDHRESAFLEAGDLIQATTDGTFSRDGVAGEIGEVIDGRVAGRMTEHEITLFKSVGVAAQDAVCAARILRIARSEQK